MENRESLEAYIDQKMKEVWDTLAQMAEEGRKRAEEVAEASRKREEEAAEECRKRAKEATEASRKREEEFVEASRKRAKEDEEARRKRAEESAENKREFDLQIKQINASFGGYADPELRILEDEFLAAIQEKKRIDGIALDNVEVRLRRNREYDLVGVNGDAVVVGEVKRNLQVNDVVEFVDKVSHHFAKDFPDCLRPKVYGMVAGEAIDAEARKAAKKYGLFILRLKNKALVVENAKHAKPLGMSVRH